jgi:hypothetical protein
MASLELIKEIIVNLYNLGFEEEIPRKYLIQQIVLSTRSIDIGASTRLIRGLIESNILRDSHADGSVFALTSFAYSIAELKKPEPKTELEAERQAKTEIKELLGDGCENATDKESK